VVVVMSEFGRTARENGTGGTDHGHGNVMWVLGGKVNGGRVYGDWQGLEDAALNEGRDLPVTTDFRSVLAQVAERHLLLSDKQLAQVFPAMPQRPPAFRLLAAECRTYLTLERGQRAIVVLLYCGAQKTAL
jgi:uncharacterized protein (DUF1501 family)